MQFQRQPTLRLANLTLSALLVGTLLTLSPVRAQDAATPAAEITPQTVVATVGGEPITEADISFAAEDLQQELQQIPAEERKAFLVTVLIDMKVMAKAAREQKMDETDLFKMRRSYLEERALRRAYFGEKIATAATPEALQAAYDTFVSTFQGREEVHTRHILVATEDEAKAVKAELEGGKDFAELASEKSIDPSAKQNGGDLGFFGKGMMVQPFEQAAFTMEPGTISDPVKSDFGWHIIRLEEKRMGQPPTLEQVVPQLQQQLMFKNFETAVSTLKEGVAIEIPDAALAEGVKQQNDQQVVQAQ